MRGRGLSATEEHFEDASMLSNTRGLNLEQTELWKVEDSIKGVELKSLC